ncbi:MAG: CBS domain-containing protein [Candidatus Aenigmatarchaeota archaeon]
MATGIKVKDAMVNRVVTAMPDQTVLEGSKIMKKEGVGSLIICEGKDPIGIVTREDVVNKIAALDLLASKAFLKDIMTTKLITCTPEQDISEAAALMSKNKYERIPVISMGKLIGIVSAREIAKVAPSALEVLTEHLRIEEIMKMPEETNSGDCDLCGNYSEELHSINDKWVCDSCSEEAAEL